MILDGKRLEEVSCAIEVLNDPESPAYGFLTGPLDSLRMARRARQVQIELEDGEVVDAVVREVNPTGLALIAVRPSKTRD